ncbi:hypothetical protein CRYUN_Cryun28dG0070200 [Craigia yunnanensis]
MAITTTTSKPARQLGDLLQEQQEPFILEVYLSERGCVRKNLPSGANFIGYHGNTGKFLKKFGSQNQSKKGIPHFPKVLKVVLCNKFFTIKGLRTKNSDDEERKLSVTEMDRNNQETAEPDRFSSASSTTVYNSCSDSDIDEPSIFADNFKSNLKLYDEREKKAEKKHEREEKGKEFIGSEENGKVIFVKMKRRGDEPNIMELLDSTKEWNDFEWEKRDDIGVVIGNAIVEEITSEVVMDMISVLQLRNTDSNVPT